MEKQIYNKGDKMSKDIGNKCVYCLEDTSFGSGRFVNRIPADTDDYDGYACAECMQIECDRCNTMIDLDGEIRWNNMVLHEECLTTDEHIEYDKQEGIE